MAISGLQLNAAGLKSLVSHVHFACTSEDVNNVAYGLMVQDARYVCEVFVKSL
jgi:adenylosuccinate lyase